ncbi:MAG: hypothetical protein PHY47_00200 [Lachnospiraceae bacterium]|nr:hypothetical protein [Lachnospiraceae bacterium]
MTCVIVDKEREVLSIVKRIKELYLDSLFSFIPEGDFLLFFDSNYDFSGPIKCNENFDIEKGIEEIEIKKTKIPRIFFWEKYLDTINNYPDRNHKEIHENQIHIFNGGTEETVPYPLPEDEIKTEKIRVFTVKETIKPKSVYDRTFRKIMSNG